MMTTISLWLLRTFAHPWLLVLAILLPTAVATLVVVSRRRRQVRLGRLADPVLLPRLGGPSRLPSVAWRATRLGVAAALIGIALAGPRWGNERNLVQGEGADVVLAVDASLSMLAEDVRPSRLELAKQEIRRLRALSPGDRFALLAFAGRSYILSPLTIDDSAIELFLDNLDPSIVGQGGSSLARTINQGVELLSATDSPAGRALVIFSDGEVWETQQDVDEAVQRARAAGVRLVTVGFGTPAGSTIPVHQRDGTVRDKRDENGAVVVTRYEPQFLEVAAQSAGGQFIPADATDKAGRIRSALNGLRTERRSIARNEMLTPRFQLFLFPAVIILLLDTLFTDNRFRLRGLRRRAIAAATAGALLLSMTPVPARADDVADAAAAFRAGRYAEAVAAYRRAILAGDDRPELLYNLGTALLAADSLSAAAEVLERVAAVDGEIREQALYNLGLAQLQAGLAAEGGDREQSLDAALASYKQLLIARPDDADARWNYELALREKEEQSGGGGGGGRGGGGGGGGEDEQGGGGGDRQAPGALDRQQAEQLLNSAAREEQTVQGKRQRQVSPEPPRMGKDW